MANLFRGLTETSVVAVEYHYGRWDVTDGQDGENSRIQITMRVAK